MSDTAMIAFLPANAAWVKQDFPHMTLVYAGPIADRETSDLNVMAKDGISAARATGSFTLNVTGVETLGDAGEEVDALMLYPTPQLIVARQMVEKWNRSEFSDLLPHVSIGPAGSAFSRPSEDRFVDSNFTERRRNVLPSSVYFDRLAVCWGNDRLIFSLNNYDY
jgi:2'-5' RNA ligase